MTKQLTKPPFWVNEIKKSILAKTGDEDGKVESVFGDRRMGFVWKELMAEKRNVAGVYLHTAVDNPRNLVLAQQRACAKVFHFVIHAARNPIPTSKWEQNQRGRDEILGPAATSREYADRMAAAAIADPTIAPGAAYAMLLAQKEEKSAQYLISQMRTPDDPLVVSNDRGDPFVRGILTMAVARLREIYGKDLYQVAATITEVITGQPVSKQAARSAARKNREFLGLMKSNT